jgi:hypothetical protein
MNDVPARIVSVCAVGAAVAAITVSFLHTSQRGPTGPQGRAGPQGSIGKSAQLSRLGICWSAPASPSLASDGVSGVGYVDIESAILDNGVYTCPQGDTFVSVVPQPSATP